MTYEIEKKYRLKNPQAMRRLLHKLGAKTTGTGREENLFFDRTGNLSKKRMTLRLRLYQGKGLLTLKGPRLVTRSKAVRRLELETPLDFKAAWAILTAMGFKLWLRYTKRRETFNLLGSEVVLDYFSGRGWFMEIEGTIRKIEMIEKRLGLGRNDIEPRSYVEMFRRK